jgi:hypothetical protein
LALKTQVMLQRLTAGSRNSTKRAGTPRQFRLPECALALAERARDGERRHLRTALKNLVALYRARGRYAEAEKPANNPITTDPVTLMKIV